jgi:hypothetical protein
MKGLFLAPLKGHGKASPFARTSLPDYETHGSNSTARAKGLTHTHKITHPASSNYDEELHRNSLEMSVTGTSLMMNVCQL